MMISCQYEPVKFPWWVVFLFVALAVLLVMSTGCATCEPMIIKVPVEVMVPVPVPPEPVPVPAPPEIEVCEGDVLDVVRCIGRNIERLKLYAQKLLDEIEAYNAAITE
jgi:hypothetical protein